MIKMPLVLLTACLFGAPSFAQESEKKESETSVPKNWHQLDPATSGYN